MNTNKIIIGIITFSTFLCIKMVAQKFNNRTNIYSIQEADLHSENTDPFLQAKGYKTIPEFCSGTVLDSIHEFLTLGIYSKSYKWYYSYNNEGKIESSERKYYNSKGEYKNIFETMTYNADGQIALLTKTEPHSGSFHQPNIEPTIVYFEQYNYSNGLLAMRVREETGEFPDVDTTWFNYKANNLLECRLYSNWGSYVAEKFSYKITDSIIITQKSIFLNIQYPHFDSVPESSARNSEFIEKLDKNGNVIELKCSSINTDLNTENIRYKITYTYNENNQLTQLLFYADDDVTESNKINYTYTADGNLKQYIKRYYNSHTETWDIEKQMEYFYSSSSVGIQQQHSKELCLFPNPANNYISINNADIFNKPYTIYNVNGQLQLKGKMQGKIDVSKLNNGYYLIKVENKGEQYSSSFMKIDN